LKSGVRETHLFLSDSEIKKISNYILQALSSIAHLIVAFNDENNPKVTATIIVWSVNRTAQ